MDPERAVETPILVDTFTLSLIKIWNEQKEAGISLSYDSFYEHYLESPGVN
jgi:hypothetical protein